MLQPTYHHDDFDDFLLSALRLLVESPRLSLVLLLVADSVLDFVRFLPLLVRVKLVRLMVFFALLVLIVEHPYIQVAPLLKQQLIVV
jgi:hypothetical protein